MRDDRKRASGDALEKAVLEDLAQLHGEIDAETQALSERHRGRLQCRRGCDACCVDDLTVSRVEAERIRRAHPELLSKGAPREPGACAFLDSEGACRIYAERPSVCRSQGLPLRFFFEDEEGEIEEQRDICPLNEPGGPPLDELPEADCWLIGPHEHRLGIIDDAYAEASASVTTSSLTSSPASARDDDPPRVSLRSLFAEKER